MFYQLYELNHAALQPMRAMADATRLLYSNPMNPFAQTPWGRSIAGMAELFERTTRRYGKPDFGLTSTVVDWKTRWRCRGRSSWSQPFCNAHPFRARPAGCGHRKA
jgi:poly(3-hydroxybutyrate) depolymerase